MNEVPADRVREHTAGDVNTELDERAVASVAALLDAPRDELSRRIAELDREWDVERVLEANAASLTLVGALLSLSSRRWIALATIVPAFLLQHALQGWCPPLELIRRLGVRTRKEIDAERVAVKALRGDFEGLPAEASGVDGARRLLDAASRG